MRQGHGQVVSIDADADAALSFLFLQIVQDLSNAKIYDTASTYFPTCRNASECFS
jgi:hypothetical protein